MVIYFTGTGNSRYCAEKIAQLTEDELTDATLLIKSRDKGSFVSDKPFVFVAPTYSWQIPHVFEKFIRESSFEGNRNAYFVMTCGDDVGNAGEYNEKLAADKGLLYKGTAEIKMPENYIAMFDVPDEKRCVQIMKEAEASVAEAAELIASGKTLPMKKAGLADKAKSGFINTLFYALCVSSKPFRGDDRCISCGKCEKLCPMNAVKLVDGKPVWGEGCTHCMACISYCPTKAIEYGKKSVGKRRYMCEDYKG